MADSFTDKVAVNLVCLQIRALDECMIKQLSAIFTIHRRNAMKKNAETLVGGGEGRAFTDYKEV